MMYPINAPMMILNEYQFNIVAVAQVTKTKAFSGEIFRPLYRYLMTERYQCDGKVISHEYCVDRFAESVLF